MNRTLFKPLARHLGGTQVPYSQSLTYANVGVFTENLTCLLFHICNNTSVVGAFGLSPVVPVDCQPMSLSTILRNRINELEMSISDLARRSGVSRATVIRILGGKDEHYSVSNLQAVLSALGMKMDLLAIPAAVVFSESIWFSRQR